MAIQSSQVKLFQAVYKAWGFWVVFFNFLFFLFKSMLSLSKIQSYFFDSFLCINVKKKKKKAFNHERGGEEGGSTVRKGMSKMDL